MSLTIAHPRRLSVAVASAALCPAFTAPIQPAIQRRVRAIGTHFLRTLRRRPQMEPYKPGNDWKWGVSCRAHTPVAPLPIALQPENTALKLLPLPSVCGNPETHTASRYFTIKIDQAQFGQALLMIDDAAALAHGARLPSTANGSNWDAVSPQRMSQIGRERSGGSRRRNWISCRSGKPHPPAAAASRNTTNS